MMFLISVSRDAQRTTWTHEAASGQPGKSVHRAAIHRAAR
jgi:hypothetical protein